MDLAIEEAIIASKNGEVPVGAVIIDPNCNLLSKARNRKIELNDPTAHAEILAIRLACSKIGQDRLINCSIYVTLEPCSMCASAISQARLKKLFYGASDNKSGGVETGARIFQHTQTHFKPEVYLGLREEKIALLMKKFFSRIRLEKNMSKEFNKKEKNFIAH